MDLNLTITLLKELSKAVKVKRMHQQIKRREEKELIKMCIGCLIILLNNGLYYLTSYPLTLAKVERSKSALLVI
jgi:hypothetical protein